MTPVWTPMVLDYLLINIQMKISVSLDIWLSKMLLWEL